MSFDGREIVSTHWPSYTESFLTYNSVCFGNIQASDVKCGPKKSLRSVMILPFVNPNQYVVVVVFLLDSVVVETQ